MSKFSDKVLKVVKLIPSGKVVSYGQVALYVGVPRAARQVGWILNGLGNSSSVPWWRVVNNKGRISIKSSNYLASEQKKLLENEGLEIEDNLTFDIEKYRFLPNAKILNKLELDYSYLDLVSQKLEFSKYFCPR